MSGCSQGSHIFEVVFIRDRRQPTFTIVAEVNGSFFLFSQCPCHRLTVLFLCMRWTVPSRRRLQWEAFLANSILRTARERRKRKSAAFVAGASSPLGVLPSALVLVCCVADYLRRALRSLKKNAAPATQVDGKWRGLTWPKGAENSSRNASRDWGNSEKKLSQLSGHLALDWVIFALFP